MNNTIDNVEISDISSNSCSISKNDYIHINLLKKYIDALTVNINDKHLHKHVNLIFDSGAVNGLMGIGAAMYINTLKHKGYIHVNKISGCSIGSIIAIWFIFDCPEKMYYYVSLLFSYYKKHNNFYIYHKIINKVIYELFSSDDMSIINNKLYINYYDTIKHINKVVTIFKNREHLIQCIIRSSHVPFFTCNQYKIQDRYIDGISPYIFNNNDNNDNSEIEYKNIIVKLINLHNPIKSINIKYESNIYTRIIRGIVETNDFFINDVNSICNIYNSNRLCYYVNYRITINLFIRKYFILFFIFIFDLFISFHNNLPTCIKTSYIYNNIIFFIKKNINWFISHLNI
jgi:hypothetical protein